MTCDEWKCLKIAETGCTQLEMNVCKSLYLAENGQTWLDMVVNGYDGRTWFWQERVEMLESVQNGQKLIKMAEHGWIQHAKIG